jgi:chromosome segregation ATPase
MNPADTIREATNLIRDAVGFALAEKNIPRAPTWTELVPAHLDAIAAALTELEQQLATAEERERNTFDRLEAAEADRDREKEIVAKLDLEHAALTADRDRLADALRRHRERLGGFPLSRERLLDRIEEAEADRDRLAADLELIRIGQWNTGTGKNLTAREFARAALDRHTKEQT